MLIDATDNYRVWDNTEPVKLTSIANAASGGDQEYSLPLAKRRAPTFRELSASGGVYTAMDLVFLIPKAIVDGTSGKRPKPGDRITDSDDVVWTILECPLNALKSTYRCMARDIILAADLHGTLTIKRPGVTTDDAGAREYTYTTVYEDIACRFQETGATVSDERGQRLTVKTYSVWVERRLLLTIEDQVLDADDNIYELKGWQDADRIDQLQRLECERRW